MWHSLLVLASLAPAAADEDLAKAMKEAASASSYAFSITGPQDAGGGVEGKYVKGQPVRLTADKVEFFRKGERLVYKQGDSWVRTKTGVESDPLRILAASAKVRAAALPHEELAELRKHLEGAKKAKEKGQTVYAIDLSADAAKALTRAASFRRLARGGKATLWLDEKGRLTRYEVTVTVKGSLGNAEVDGERKTAVTLSGLGTTKVEVPDGVKKALE